jgi:phospholipid/cholesterol/gamma-HCH transport system ATP-binding protein
MRVVEYLAFRAELKGVPRAERRKAVGTAMEKASVAQRADTLIGRLSKGFKQRVGLADALVANPPLLILDEPTAGLDPIAASAFDELVLYLRDTLRLTIVMVTHDLDTLARTCDRVAVLVDRKVIVDTLEGIVANEHPWIRHYFHGGRGRAVRAAQEDDRGA